MPKQSKFDIDTVAKEEWLNNVPLSIRVGWFFNSIGAICGVCALVLVMLR